MNPRIRKLAEDCGFYFYDMTDVDGQNLGYSVESDNFGSVDKLVEAIVRECDRYVAERWDNSEPWMNPGDLLTHFGIEDNE